MRSLRCRYHGPGQGQEDVPQDAEPHDGAVTFVYPEMMKSPQRNCRWRTFPRPSPWAPSVRQRCSQISCRSDCYGLIEGDANMRSAWVCTRNDLPGNLAVLLAALGVFGMGTGWPDVIVASIMAGLALEGAWFVLRQSPQQMRIAPSPA
jgi:Co/Zn/Cd efflux system component